MNLSFFVKGDEDDDDDDEEEEEKDEFWGTLTADCLAVSEDFINFWVHVNVHLGVLCNLLMTSIHPLLHPDDKRLADQGHDHVDDVLPKEDENVFNRLNPNILDVKNNITFENTEY